MAVGLAVVARALGPVLLKIGPMLTDWMAKNGVSALDSMLKSPQRRPSGQKAPCCDTS